MPTERHHFQIKSTTPPVIQWDPDADAIYVRFSNRRVARTIDQSARKMNITVDLDARGEVIGIEAIGVSTFTLRRVLDAAMVETPNMDLAGARFVYADAIAC